MPNLKSVVIANEFIKLAIERNSRGEGRLLTQMDLFKLIYFANGVSLASSDKPLVEENFEAWVFGPVLPDLYHNYLKRYSSSVIKSPLEISENNIKDNNIDEKEILIIKNILENFVDEGARKMSTRTHKANHAWEICYFESGRNATIPSSKIKKDFVPENGTTKVNEIIEYYKLSTES